jgi:hypothetical protein
MARHFVTLADAWANLDTCENEDILYLASLVEIYGKPLRRGYAEGAVILSPTSGLVKAHRQTPPDVPEGFPLLYIQCNCIPEPTRLLDISPQIRDPRTVGEDGFIRVQPKNWHPFTYRFGRIDANSVRLFVRGKLSNRRSKSCI